MIIHDTIIQALEKYKGNNTAFLRTVIKESLQEYILNFVYTHARYKELIFTGGTCLRKIYELSRLSEDIDFDFTDTFSIDDFANDVKSYFKTKLSYSEITTKIAGHQRSIFIRFPSILSELQKNYPISIPSTVLFVRCDFSQDTIGMTHTETHPIATGNFSFFVRSYDLPTLFTNKMHAFLQRNFFKGSTQSIPFKGRDVFDLMWFLEKSVKTNYKMQPNWPRLQTMTGMKTKQEIIGNVQDKIALIKPADIKLDLAPFISDQQTIDTFAEHFQEILKRQLEDMNRYEAG